MLNVEKQPHIGLTANDIRNVVIVMGDPGRVETYGKMCDEHREVAYNREYRTFDCTLRGKHFMVSLFVTLIGAFRAKVFVGFSRSWRVWSCNLLC